MTELTDLNITEAKEAMAAKKVSAAELTEAYIKNMEKSDLNAYVTDTFAIAREQAKSSDGRIARGEIGLLEGVPMGIKDLFCVEGTRTTASSKILEDFIAPYTSTVAAKLFNAGGVMLGKTNLDEFAMGSATITSYFGPTKSPWKRKSDGKELVPGGSSGGSAAAVAGGLALCATGTDTGGSVRQPAAFTGIVGLKPTYGLCSRFGVIAFASSLDTMSPMARTVEDTALMLQAMAGYDPKDSTSYNAPVPDYAKAITGDIRGMKIGIPKEYRPSGLNPEINRMWDEGIKWLEAAGATVKEISLPHTRYALAAYYIIAPAEASSNLARYDGVRYGIRVDGDTLDGLYSNTRSAGFGIEVKRRILTGTHILSQECYQTHYVKATKVRTLIAEDFKKAFAEVDFLLAPACPTPAFALDEAGSLPPKDMYLNDVYTLPASLAGVPAISVPAAMSAGGLPLGLQLIGRQFDETRLLNVASVVEKAAALNLRPSKIGGVK